MNYIKYSFDVIIVGGGHAGIESSFISSKMCNKVLLITYNINSIGNMSCNPSIGGIGKSNLVKEIDALGGLIGKLSDNSGIHFRTLNISKGYAVRATRIQIDKKKYKKNTIRYLKSQKNLFILQDEVIDLIIKNNKIIGVKTKKNNNIFSKTTIITTGTFLDSKIFIGNYSFLGGRIFDHSSKYLANSLKKYFNDFNYLKTGTPPRIYSKSINFKILKKQYSMNNNEFSFFSFLNKKKKIKSNTICYITKTNKLTHKIIKNNLDKSPLYNGTINSIGPRYCPSIEDKIVKFPNKNNHQIFLEPEGKKSKIIYPNGISTSLPINIQKKFIKTIKGLENCLFIKPGYAVKYLYFNPKNLKKTLETKKIKNLFFAGQINGTTGYEEAASQGLIAGINASLKINKNKFYINKFIPDRSISYIGVLIDDLCIKGITEPYRMFTSRSEHRLFLREDNADFRLTPISKKLGLINNKTWLFFKKKMELIKNTYKIIKKKKININYLPKKITNIFYKKKKNKYINLISLLKNPTIKINEILNLIPNKYIKKNIFIKEVEIIIKYEDYIKKQKYEINKLNFYKNINIPKNINFKNIPGLSNEIIQKLTKIKPLSLNQAYKISGITPAAIIIILIYIKKNIKNKNF